MENAMLFNRLAAFSGFAVIALFAASPANALTMAECSAKFNAAKEAGTLDGQTWNAFRKAECGADAKPEKKASNSKKATKPQQEETASDDAAKGLSAKECSAKYQAAKDADALNGMKWNDFRKSECGPGATAELAPAKAKKASKAAAAALSDDAGEAKGLSMKDCSAKYQNAKADGSLGGMKWNEFRKTKCGTNASDDDSVPSLDEASYSKEPDAPATRAPRGVKFPNAIARKFSEETPAKARMRTCLEQYYANKDNDLLGGLRWIQKGGGYYSLCNAKLKEAAG
jgi:hypothetical protein